jgi:oligoribonuclease
MIFVDIETTGLVPETNKILEVGVIVTDSNLNEIDLYNIQINHENFIFESENVEKMHNSNGLIDLCNSSTFNLKDSESRLLDFIKKYSEFKKEPMCGSSICFVRRFLIYHMPSFENYFHYRNIDVSSIMS